MSKKRRRHEQIANAPTVTRYHQSSLAKLLTVKVSAPSVSRSVLRQVEDRREFHPLGRRQPAKMVSGVTAKKLKVKPNAKNKALSARLAFSAAPKKVALCVRRARRKEVLFAFNKTGRRSSHSRKRRNLYSSISCL